MRYILILLLFLSVACDGQIQGVISVGNSGEESSNIPNSFAEFRDEFSPIRTDGAGANPVIINSSPFTNLAPSGAIIDPNDPSKFLLYVNELKGNTRVEGRIRLYEGEVADPVNGTYTDEGIVLDVNPLGGTPDDRGVALGSVFLLGDTVYLFHQGSSANSGLGTSTICKAYSLDGGRTFTRKGQVLAPDMVTFHNFTDPTVYEHDGVFYMDVTAKDNSGSFGLPNLGLAKYTSTNYGESWTYEGMSVTMGPARAFDGVYMEGGGRHRFPNGDEMILYTANGGGNTWAVGIASSDDLLAEYTKESLPWLQHSLDGTSDSRSVAVTILVELNGYLYAFIQGTNQFQPADTWDICISRITRPVDPFPVGQLRDRGLWTGTMDFFETQGDVTFGSETRSIRALENVGYSTVYIDHPTDVTAASNSSYQVSMRATVTATNVFIGGFYVMEGSNVVTGIYFRNGNLQYLASGATWTNMSQTVSANTEYDVQVVLETNSTIDIYVNGVQRVNNGAPNTNISVKADGLRLEKASQTTTLVYFGELSYTNSGVNTIIDYGQ